MKSLREFRDLRGYGFNILTGEACRIGRRILCDMNDQAAGILRDLMGIAAPPLLIFNDNWNSGSAYSAMIPYSLFEDLCIWCLVNDGCAEIVVVEDGSAGGLKWEGGVYGSEGMDDEQWKSFLDVMDRYGKSYRRVWMKRDQPGHGTRCTHQMSGRTN